MRVPPIGVPTEPPAGDGGSSPTGTTADPILLEPADWFFVFAVAIFDIDYDNGPTDNGVGATITALANGALSALVATSAGVLEDGKLSGASAGVTDPAVGERVLYTSTNGSQGVYTITDVGSGGTPWVMTRASDTDDPADSLLDFRIALAGTPYLARTSRYGPDDDFGTSEWAYGWAVAHSSGFAAGAGGSRSARAASRSAPTPTRSTTSRSRSAPRRCPKRA